ncbi:hypothetical protein AXH09_18240 [Pseudomonas aeruginosa]|nr:hypothetical protein AXH09_18240 [Pseudomonas aeruginosa]
MLAASREAARTRWLDQIAHRLLGFTPTCKAVDEIPRIQSHCPESSGTPLADLMPMSAVKNHGAIPWHLILPREKLFGVIPFRLSDLCSVSVACDSSAYIE